MSEATVLDLSRRYEKLASADSLTEFGIVEKIVGNSIESQGPNATVGSVCWLSNGEKEFPVEVVGFTGGKVVTMPLGKVEGVRQGNLLRVSGHTASIGMSDSLRGRVLDGLGRPLDGRQLPTDLVPQALYADPSNPMDRDPIREMIQTGVRSIDGLLTCGMGQRIGIFGGSGVGKSTLLGMIAKYTSADINIIALVGERGREVREFLENDLGESGLQRSLVFVSTSDQPALVRIRAAFAATAAAEYFRDRGFNVMLMMDSVTRFAMAQREVGLAAGEPPSSKGYTPSVFSLLPRLLERSGKFAKGSITAFYTVLVEGDDMNDPIADSVRSILDGHIVLDRKLAGRGHYPCIDVLNSISRLMSQLVDENLKTAAYAVRDLMAVHKDSEDLINIGAYKRGSNPRIDRAIDKIDSINSFLKQRAEEPSDLSAARSGLLSPGEMKPEEERLQRIERLLEVRQTFVTAAEGRIREAELHVRICEEAAEERDRQIRKVREEIAYLDHSTGAAIQNRERYIFSLHVRARQAREALEKARKVLDGRRSEWRESMREQKVIEKVQERRLQEWQQSVDVADQKHVDEMTLVRYARNQSNRQPDESERPGTAAAAEDRR